MDCGVSVCIHYIAAAAFTAKKERKRERERENGTREQTCVFSYISIYTTDITHVLSTSAIFLFFWLSLVAKLFWRLLQRHRSNT